MISIVEITPKGRDFIKSGHVWIFANEFFTKMKSLEVGQWVEFNCKNEFIGYGYVNPHSLIAGRVCSRQKIENRKDLFSQLIREALGRRGWDGALPMGSWRVVYSESDSLPGLIVDLYKNKNKTTVVALSSTAGMDQAIDDWIQSLIEVFNPDELIVRGDSSVRHLEGIKNFKKIVRGEEDAIKEGVVWEDDVLFAADFLDGQKSGFFIDQRENRRHLKSLIQKLKTQDPKREIKVLDLCSYSGGWGISALKGGADHVTFVDQSADAIELCKKGLKLNEIDESRAQFITKDVFDFLESSARGESFDIVICDPPAFVKSKKNIKQAEQAYYKLNTLAVKAMRGGTGLRLLYACSCSYHMSDERFAEILGEVFKKQGLEAEVVRFGTQGFDHPWILNRPESKYLKCLVLKFVNKQT